MKKLMLMAIAIVLAITPVSAKDKTKNRDKKQKGQPAAQQAPQPPKPSVSRHGMFDITKVNADWFMEIPDSLLEKDILAITRYTSTPSNSGKFGGEMCNEQVVYFQKGVDGNLLLRSRMTVTELVPNEAICSSITLLAPSPTANAAMTAPTPMMMPSVVRNERVLLRRRARMAMRKISMNEITGVPPF